MGGVYVGRDGALRERKIYTSECFMNLCVRVQCVCVCVCVQCVCVLCVMAHQEVGADVLSSDMNWSNDLL